MKRMTNILGCLLAVSSIGLGKPMNVIFILADDLGWSDTTLYGTTELYQTPNIERLAARGMTFTQAYAASPLCSPTWASLLTGRNPARLGLTIPNCHLPTVRLKAKVKAKCPPGDKALQVDSVSRLDTKLPTLGKLLKGGGYATGHFGKWHLGPEPYSPLEHGFDVDIPRHPGPGPAGGFVAPWKFKSLKANRPKEHIEDRMSEEAIAWMMKAVDGDKPFFMNYWQFSVHAPFDAKAELIEKTTLASVYPAKVAALNQLMENYTRDAKVEVPAPNQNFNPAEYEPEKIGVPKKKGAMTKAPKKKQKANT